MVNAGGRYDPAMVTQDRVRQLALRLPEAAELPHFDRPSFRVRGKIFATMPPGPETMVVRLPADRRALLIEVEPAVFSLTPWTAGGWTRVDLGRIDDERLAELLEASWRGVVPKRLAATLGTDWAGDWSG